MKEIRPEILIIGAGISGIALALGLKRAGRDVLLVEKNTAVSRIFKGEFLQPFAVRALESLGDPSLFESTPVKITELRFRELSASGDPVEEFLLTYPDQEAAVVIPHDELLMRLWATARAELGERFMTGTVAVPQNLGPYFSSEPRILIRNAKSIPGSPEEALVKPSWLIGCDGLYSKVREWIGGDKFPTLASPVLAAKPHFIAGCEVPEASGLHHRYEIVRTYDSGTFSFFNLNDRTSRLYWSVLAQKGPGTRESWERQMENFLESNEKVTGIKSRKVARTNAATAASKYMGPAASGRSFLVGDALSYTTPFGGQGMASAMHHVRCLLEYFSTASPESLERGLPEIRKAYSKRAKAIYYHYGILNTAMYYLFFSRPRIFKDFTSAVLMGWKSNAQITDRVAGLFGGTDEKTPSIREIIEIVGPETAIGMARRIGERLLKTNENFLKASR